jgi:hypothetical protein
VRGPAFIDGDEIVLIDGKAELYAAFEPEYATRLLSDLGNLARLGEPVEGAKTYDFRLTDKQRALEFAETHGFLWHGPGHVGHGGVRESLRDWFDAGLWLSMSMALYRNISQSQEEDSAKPVRRYLRTQRDAGLFKHIRLPDADNELLDYARIQLAELVSRGMAECTPTFVATCGLVRDGAKADKASKFGFANDAGSLVGAAYYWLALLIANKKRIMVCGECEEIFIPEHASQRYHKKCGARKRQRERRARLAQQ